MKIRGVALKIEVTMRWGMLRTTQFQIKSKVNFCSRNQSYVFNAGDRQLPNSAERSAAGEQSSSAPVELKHFAGFVTASFFSLFFWSVTNCHRLTAKIVGIFSIVHEAFLNNNSIYS